MTDRERGNDQCKRNNGGGGSSLPSITSDNASLRGGGRIRSHSQPLLPSLPCELAEVSRHLPPSDLKLKSRSCQRVVEFGDAIAACVTCELNDATCAAPLHLCHGRLSSACTIASSATTGLLRPPLVREETAASRTPNSPITHSRGMRRQCGRKRAKPNGVRSPTPVPHPLPISPSSRPREPKLVPPRAHQPLGYCGHRTDPRRYLDGMLPLCLNSFYGCQVVAALGLSG